MDEYIVQGSLGMPRGSSLRVEDGRGILVYVWEGEIWLTQDGSPEDHMLLAGQWFRLDRDGTAIAHSFRRSVVTMTAPDPDWHARRIVLTKGAAAAPVVLHREAVSRARHALRRFRSRLFGPDADAGAAVAAFRARGV